jgi:hypothetical protein
MNKKKEPVAARVAQQHQQNSNSGNYGVARERREGGGREDERACVRASERARACGQKQGAEKKEPKKGKEGIPALSVNSKRPPTRGLFFGPFLFFSFCGDHPREDLAKFSKQNKTICKKIWLNLQILAKVLAFTFRLKFEIFGFKKEA